MGKIRRPPKPVVYISPETEIPLKGTVIAQEQELELGRDGEYTRVLELIKWEEHDPEEEYHRIYKLIKKLDSIIIKWAKIAEKYKFKRGFATYI